MGFEKYILIFAYLTVVYKLGIKADFKPEVKQYCIGKYHMSDIRPNMRIKDRSYSTLQCQNCAELPQRITLDNTGLTLLLNFTYNDMKQIPTITNGPLEGKGTYRFKHAYFNGFQNTPEDWGFNNIHFPAELHMVFYNIKHEDYETSLGQHEGIAVFSVAFRVRTSSYRHELEAITNGLKHITNAYSNTSIPVFDLFSLFPHIISDYYTYIGTMISDVYFRRCQSDVIWIDFEQSHKITPEQVTKFADLRTYYQVPLIHHEELYKGPGGVSYRSIPIVDPSQENNNGQNLSLSVGVLLCMIVSMFIY